MLWTMFVILLVLCCLVLSVPIRWADSSTSCWCWPLWYCSSASSRAAVLSRNDAERALAIHEPAEAGSGSTFLQVPQGCR